MSLARTYSSQLTGLHAEIISIEVDISRGLHAFTIVGLGDRAVEEARDRISAAIKNSGFVSPKQKNQKVVISLAPADLRKGGPGFDLAMAIAYLAASEDISSPDPAVLFFGELALDGSLRPIRGLLASLTEAHRHGFTAAFIPTANAAEASLASGITAYAAASLREVIGHLTHKSRISPLHSTPAEDFSNLQKNAPPVYAETAYDLAHIRGNEHAKRALEIAAAGGHALILCGPPGTGKTLLARSLISLLPPLTRDEAIEVTSIHSAAGVISDSLILHPPFRAPHHTSSAISLIGGGAAAQPGEITLAHRGILFLDEFPEFDRKAIEVLRQPLEDRCITISRARGSVTFPAACLLVAAMNPCPCGRGKDGGCVCSTKKLEHYRQRLSAPILDRIDLWVNIQAVEYDKLSSRGTSESSQAVAARVAGARLLQRRRFERHGFSIALNRDMEARHLAVCAALSSPARQLLTETARRLKLSGRSFHRIIKVSRTIADLGNAERIEKEHLLEALSYRQRN